MADFSTNREHTHDVFLSHSSLDKPIVLELAQRLRADGLRVWIDEWEIKAGDSIPSKVEQGLENSRVLVLCMSKSAFGSDWATLESQTFRFRDPLNKLRRFMPLRLDDTEPPGSLKQFKYVDWRDKDREESYQRLLNACVGTEASFSSSQQRTEPEGNAEESCSTSAAEIDTDDSQFDERTAQLHAEIRKYIAEFNAEILAKLANAFELKLEANLSLQVAQQLLFDYIVGTQYKLPRALNRTHTVHSSCDANNKRRIKEILIRLCPLRFDTKEIYRQVRKQRRGKVSEIEIAEVLMAGVDGAPAHTKQDFHQPGLTSEKLPEMGFPSGGRAATSSPDELKTLLADLHSILCKRLSVREIAEKSVDSLANALKLQCKALSEKNNDRTVYCVLVLPEDETHRQHSLELINNASEKLEEIVWIEYHPEHSASEREFSNAFAWILNLDD